MSDGVDDDVAPREPQDGMMVNLANGQAAMLRKVEEAGVLLDCNHPLAGEPPPPPPAAA